mgnify:FL=1
MNGKIHYVTPRISLLSGGSWGSGWSGISEGGGDKKEYEVIDSTVILEEGKWYNFELIGGQAKILIY